VDAETQADAIVGKLRNAGFSDNDISVLFPDKGIARFPDQAREQEFIEQQIGSLLLLSFPSCKARNHR
jgi:hypothetical protein